MSPVGGPGGNRQPVAQGGVNGDGSGSRAHLRTASSSGLARSHGTTQSARERLGLSRPTQQRTTPQQQQRAPQNQQRQQHQQNTPSRPSSRHSAIPDTQSVGAPTSSYRATSHESSKENMAPPDAEEYELQRRRIEELKAEVGTLQYQVNTFEQEKEMARLQHDTELRDARRKAEDDFKQRQAAEAERGAADRKMAALHEELEAARGDQDARQRDLEQKVRAAQDEARALQEQLDDLSVAKEDAARMGERRAVDLQEQLATAQRRLQEAAQEAAARDAALQQAQQQLVARDAQTGQLEAEVLRLKAQTGDAATMEIIRRELKDQVNHIRALEATNRDQLTELRHLRQAHKAVEVVEEEKRSLLRKLESARALEQELHEERMQRQRLETERRAWAAYLQTETEHSMDGASSSEFDSPEAVAKALMEARYRTAELTEKIGALEPEMAQRDADIRALEMQKKELAAEVERLKAARASSGGDGTPSFGTPTLVNASTNANTNANETKLRARLERQRALAVKEVEYLRAQLKAFDTEDMTFHPGQFDQQKADRIQQLEELVDKYRAEAEGLHRDLASLEASGGPAAAAAQIAGTKRSWTDGGSSSGSGANGTAGSDEDAQVGQLVRKTRKLQDELSAAQTAHRVLETELAVTREQLAAEKQAAGVRVLALRSNPTSDFEAVKRSTLAALKQENAELLAHIQSHAAAGTAAQKALKSGARAPLSALPPPSTAAPPFTTVPMSVLAAAQREIADAQAETASAQKASRRLKEVWAAKSAEFKEAVESTLGWHVTFIPNGKMRVESVYYPSLSADENENSIVFDGERGTMKVGGGPRSAFAQRIDDQIRFWVREKGCIPGFLAALTLEFCEEQTRTSTVTTGR
ncbi:mitotic spindle assembly checkpoint protein MAD1 [Sporothrix schenckii 1099-18]|uniref:Spindle assembly checkpoint component MAD1 n=1 Tax=Sporothrix schenckii 1099-18 TaxID=1397361 RepID=A0A0F2LZ01_SPOSC|nr:mitotic spindle assembly checkpoint protein MAD1 [Sporothrix schenckii 1099-18]KJR82054.1 mitotic spindle assembly checkpoint protein MAD1 [Sporothrix schenckii 1099-18]